MVCIFDTPYPLAALIYLVLMVVWVVVSKNVVVVCAEYSVARARDSKRCAGGRGRVGVGLLVNILASIGERAIVHSVLQVMQHTDLDALGVANKGEHHGNTQD